MKCYILIPFLLVFPSLIIAQKQNNKIEINPIVRYDNFPKHTYHYSGRYTTDYLKMKGVSYGITLSYKHPLNRNLFIKAGLGYYKYKFDKLDNTNSLTGETHVRTINFISPLFISYATDRYHYNNLIVLTGIGKEFSLNRCLSMITDFNLTAYYTSSQYYHLTSNPWDGNVNFNTKNSGFFGISVTGSAAIVKRYKRIQIGPSLIIPVFDYWKKDQVFLEGDYKKGNRKWFNGVGVGIVCNIYLHKKNEL